MPHRFFFSYSWKNLGQPLRRFFDDLTTFVRDRVGGSADDVAYRDRVTMKAGAEWPAGLIAAISTSQVLVYLQSVDYLHSDYCGRELQAFIERVRLFDRINRGADRPLFMQPVIWVPPAVSELPPVLAHAQPDDDEFPREYRTKGLESLAKQRNKKPFQQCVEIFGNRIIAAAAGDRLPVLTGYDSIEALPNAFTTGDRVERRDVGGPTEVRCVYIAGSHREINGLPSSTTATGVDAAAYGEDGWYWQPYNPPSPTTIGSIVQQMLTEYRYREVQIGDDIDTLVQELREAAQQDRIVLLVVDAWSAVLKRYREFLARFDASVPLNNAVLIPWNSADQRLAAAQGQLEANLQLLFQTKHVGSIVSPRFRTHIRTIEDFRTALLNVLEMIRAEIETRRAARLKIEGLPIPEIRTSREGT